MESIFINVHNLTVNRNDNKGQLEDLYRILKAEKVEIAKYWDNGDTLWVDENGLGNGLEPGTHQSYGFEIDGESYMGNGLIYGTNRENPELKDSVATDVWELSRKIRFFWVEVETIL